MAHQIPSETIEHLLSALGAIDRSSSPTEVHRILAALRTEIRRHAAYEYAKGKLAGLDFTATAINEERDALVKELRRGAAAEPCDPPLLRDRSYRIQPHNDRRMDPRFRMEDFESPARRNDHDPDCPRSTGAPTGCTREAGCTGGA